MEVVKDRQSPLNRKAALGQFFTPPAVAELMASMCSSPRPKLRLLDPGAGAGALFSAVIAQAVKHKAPPKEISVTAYEVDASLSVTLRKAADACRDRCKTADVRFTAELLNHDFLHAAAERLDAGLFPDDNAESFDLAILNPPYFKINTNSQTRRTIERIGVETTNIYTGFLAATARLLKPGGEMIAITPRSFCNGSYFKAFRQWFLGQMTLTHIHSFHSRQEAFRQDAVLQETVIFRAVKKAKRGKVVVTSSTGPNDPEVTRRVAAYAYIVKPDDPQHFIRIPTDDIDDHVTEQMAACSHTLDDLGLTVSTGRVVDFRAKEYLRQHPERGTVPLIWATHFENGYIAWPKNGSARKPEAFLANATVANQLVPNEPYVLVRRFSAKEERRRVVAAVYDPKRQECDAVGFENHLNYFHCDGRGLNMKLARGLAAFLNSTIFDQYFRQFSGHTQVNATDLRNMHYPTRETLERMGSRIRENFPSQDAIDALVAREVFP